MRSENSFRVSLKSKITLETEAYGLYTQNYSVMQGMTPSDGSLTKEDAPIKIDIAYTLVK